MLAHTMTPIREEEQVDGIISADVGTLNEDAHVNINVASNATASTNEEEAKTSSSSSTIVPVHEEEQVNDGNIDMAYFFQVPGVKWNPKLEMMSKAGLTQGQYERKVLAEEYVD